MMSCNKLLAIGAGGLIGAAAAFYDVSKNGAGSFKNHIIEQKTDSPFIIWKHEYTESGVFPASNREIADRVSDGILDGTALAILAVGVYSIAESVFNSL